MDPDREDKVAVLLGIEEGGARLKAKGPMSDIEAEQNQLAYAEATNSVTDTLDLNYYALGDK